MGNRGLYENDEERLRDVLLANTNPRFMLRMRRDPEGTLHLSSPSEGELDGLREERAAATTRLVIDKVMRI